MPFRSEKQRRWMHANEPEMARRWEAEEHAKMEPGGGMPGSAIGPGPAAHTKPAERPVAKMCGDEMAYRAARARGHSAEEADRIAGGGRLEKLSAKIGVTPAELRAALEYERTEGEGDEKEKTKKVQMHLRERPSYYVELERMMDADMSPLIRRSVTAATPADLKKGIVTKVQDALASRRAEKVRKQVLGKKKDSSGGGWEKGPKGGTRKRVGGKWVYGKEGSGGDGKGGAGEEDARTDRIMKQTKGGTQGLRGAVAGEAKRAAQEGKLGTFGKKGAKGPIGAAGPPPPAPGEEGSEHEHPDSPHDAHQTVQGKPIHEAIDHIHSVEPDALRARGEAVADAVSKKNPELGKQIKTAVHHLADAAQKGKALREKGKPSLKEDMTAADALKSILRDFNAAAAPASILGPELGGVLKDDPKAGKHGDGERGQAQAQEHADAVKEHEAAAAEAAKNPDAAAAAAAKPGAKGPPPKGAKPPMKKHLVPIVTLRKAKGPPPLAPVAGASKTDETPALPDFQDIYYHPEDDQRRKREEEQARTRRLSNADRNRAAFGFHGAAGPPALEPVLHYIPTDDSHTGPKRSARKPVILAKESDDRRRAGTGYGPEKDGSELRRKTDRGRVPRDGDRRNDGAAPDEKRPKARDEADDDEEEKKKQKRLAKAWLEQDDLMKAGARGGKYIKRVPYTDPKTGKRKWRYYYRESAVAREARAGEEVKVGKERLRVDELHEDGSLTITIGGKQRKLSREQYSQILARHYGYRYFDYAEKRAKQAINAVFRHVPKAMLTDLKGDTLEERLADLRQRAPKVYSKLEASFQRAGVSPMHAKDIVTRTLERRGWAPEARAAAIGSVLTDRVKAGSFYEVLRGAENLAAGSRVEAKHVGTLVDLRSPGGKPDSFADEVAKVAKAAEVELAKLSKLLASAQRGDTDARAEALAAAMTSSAIAKLNLLTQAFPGLKDKAAEEARATLLEVPSVAAGPPKTKGAETVVFVAGEGGAPKALKARYELREAGDVIASHDPTRGFQKRGDYPEGVQERAYHRDRDEQMKVMKNAQRLRPEFVVNTNPDAVNGPPMITEDGKALGGNSRTMSMQLAYHEHKDVAERMKSYLAEHAHEVGFTAEDVGAMKNPILVRVVESPEEDGGGLFGGGGKRKHTKEEMQVLVRQMNESFTQAMDPRTMQVAMGRKLDDATVKSLADGMQEGETLAQFLTSKRSETFVNKLSQAGIIDARNANQYKDPSTGRLNADGRTLVSRILVGRLVGDADVLSNTQPRTVESVARATPHLVAASAYGSGYDLGGDMSVALRDLNELRRRQADGTIKGIDEKMSESDFDGFFAQKSLFAGGSSDIDLASASNDRAKLLLWTLIKKPGSQQLATVFKDYAEQAAHHPEGQASLLGASLSPTEVLRGVVDRATKRKSGQGEEAPAKPSSAEGPGLFG